MCVYVHTYIHMHTYIHTYIHTYKHTTTTSTTTTTTTTITTTTTTNNNNNSNNNKLVIAVFCSNILYLLKLLNYLSCLLRVYMYILKTCQLPNLIPGLNCGYNFKLVFFCLFLDLTTILKLF